ncbi:cardiolipin synthase [Algoriphagus namhaensis]
MNWIVLLQVLYLFLILAVVLRVLYDTRSSVKALAYILFIVFVPVVGIFFYFSFGVNYRKNKLYSKKIIQDEKVWQEVKGRLSNYLGSQPIPHSIHEKYQGLMNFVQKASFSPLTSDNEVQLLINGEEKFPQVLQELRAARHHIHIEYYIYEEDETGKSVADILIQKAKEGLEVRLMYDAFGSNSLSKSFIHKLEGAGVQTAPFFKIKLLALANRLNYRNHRKIIVIDGKTSFVGGINMSDKYRNDGVGQSSLFWRDTHLMLKGSATAYLQYLFMCDWNFCSSAQLTYANSYFPATDPEENFGTGKVQLVSSGPDSTLPSIFYSLLAAVSSAKERLLITSPYFIPDESLMDALIIAAQSGIKVQLLVPGISDSKLVNAAARSYYTELLRFGAEIYLYNKGFVHAKTMVVDGELAIVGSANMDFRSFDLNFEINALVYDPHIAGQLEAAFINDLKDSTKIDPQDWESRPKRMHLWEKFIRLLSPFL